MSVTEVKKNSLGTKLEDSLVCAICFEIYADPRMLPCQHTFCLECLQNILNHRLRHECPTCRQAFHQDELANAPPNYLAKEMLVHAKNQPNVECQDQKDSPILPPNPGTQTSTVNSNGIVSNIVKGLVVAGVFVAGALIGSAVTSSGSDKKKRSK